MGDQMRFQFNDSSGIWSQQVEMGQSKEKTVKDHDHTEHQQQFQVPFSDHFY